LNTNIKTYKTAINQLCIEILIIPISIKAIKGGHMAITKTTNGRCFEYVKISDSLAQEKETGVGIAELHELAKQGYVMLCNELQGRGQYAESFKFPNGEFFNTAKIY
jgi:hypothetical protein